MEVAVVPSPMALEQMAVAVLFWLATNEYVPLAVPPRPVTAA